ncbi:MAG: hypothetical protein HY794_11725 [Desulfarculus sp.]|nr:hypothetical protein [Desulfarculus sp.]
MKLRAHVVAALPLGGAYYWSEGSAALAGLAVAASVLVDVDHLPDYLWWRGGWRGLEDFFESFYEQRVPRILIVTHSWELMALAWGLILALGAPPWVKALAVGWLYHLTWDQLCNSVGARFYFLLYRARLGFERRLLKPRPRIP